VTIFLLFLLGGVTGVISGYLGIGGGVILVPVLTELFLTRGMDINHTMTSAFATSLLTAVFTTGASAWRQWRLDNILLKSIPRVAAGAVIGGQFGSWLGSRLAGDVLMLLFGLFLLFAAFNLALGGQKKTTSDYKPRFCSVELISLGLITGIISALFGIGGGILMVPAFILLFNCPPVKTAGTSSSIAFLTTISGVLGYLFYGAGRAVDMTGFLGVIDLNTGIPIALGSVLTAQIGAHLNKRFGGVVYQRIFAAFLTLVAIRMLFLGG